MVIPMPRQNARARAPGSKTGDTPGRPTTSAERRQARIRKLKVGKDGKTANERFRMALGPKKQEDLVRDVNRIAEHDPAMHGGKDYCSQQLISSYVNDDVDFAQSKFLWAIAEALDVRSGWLQLGIGEMRDKRAIGAKIVEALQARGIALN